jgi:hypothetical protein
LTPTKAPVVEMMAVPVAILPPAGGAEKVTEGGVAVL